MAISTRWLPSPVTRPAHSPSTVPCPSSSRPSSRKNSIVAGPRRRGLHCPSVERSCAHPAICRTEQQVPGHRDLVASRAAHLAALHLVSEASQSFSTWNQSGSMICLAHTATTGTPKGATTPAPADTTRRRQLPRSSRHERDGPPSSSDEGQRGPARRALQGTWLCSLQGRRGRARGEANLGLTPPCSRGKRDARTTRSRRGKRVREPASRVTNSEDAAALHA
jgi:hypothetical protein